MLYRYNPKMFDTTCIEDAKKVILMDPAIPDQWETETKWTMNFFREKNLFNEESIVLDWGCGIGRLAKPIIEEYNCKVIGVDFQPSMLKFAQEYVNHPNFTAISDKEFFDLPDNYFTAGIAVWALQHALHIHTPKIIENIHKKLHNNSKFIVLDANITCWPVIGVDQDDISEDDVIFTPILDKKNDNENLNFKWLSFPSDSITEISNYFSSEEIISPLSSKNADDFILSNYFNGSWAGVFINEKKDNKTYCYT